MKHARNLPGETPVACIERLAPLPSIVVAVLRGWNRGGAGAALDVLRERMTEAQAAASMAALCDLAGLLGAARKRPLACHRPECTCVGADEAMFARFVLAASLGEREDALLLASAMVDAHAVLALTDAAQRFGLHLYRAMLCAAQDARARESRGRILH